MALLTSSSTRGERVLHYLNPLGLARNMWQHRNLIRQFSQREIEGRYKGSFLGLFWSFVNPLVLLLIYTFVFGVVYRARWPQAQSSSLAEFALICFCGLTCYNVLSECISRAPGLIVGVPNYVKKVVFPLEVLAVSSLLAALFHALVALSILLVASLLVLGQIVWTLPLLPLTLLPLVFLSLGLGWFLSSMGVFVRDISYTVALVVQILFFLTPVLYPLESVPEPFRSVIALNPMTSIIENFRRVVLWGRLPSWPDLLAWSLAGAAVMLLGYAWFMKTKKAFADVI